MIPGMTPIITSTDSGSVEFLASDSDTRTDGSGITSHTYSSLSIGAASLDRVVFACVFGSVHIDAVVDTVTIGGVSATLLASDEHNWLASFADLHAHLYAAFVPTGTTADVVVTYTGGDMYAGSCDVIAFDNVSSITPLDTGNAATDAAPSFTIDHTNGAALVALKCHYGGSGITFTGVTEITDRGNPGDSNLRSGAAYDILTATASGQSLSANDGGTANVLVAAVIK